MRGRDFLQRLWVLMATVFVDMLGFFIVLPLLPFYAERLGADATWIGALVAAFAFAQLATAPLWGRLSDRYGRRPMILGGLVMSAIAYVLFEHAGTVWVLFVSRLFQGAGGGTTGVVQAYLSDSVDEEHRSQALGWLTAATSAGVMAGPAIGSLAAAIGTVPPGYLAAGLCVLNLLFAWRWLPEPPRDTSHGLSPAERSTRKVFREVLAHPTGSVGSLIWIYSAGMMALMAMSGMLALYLQRRFGITESEVGWAYVYVGAISLVMRSLVLGPMVRRLGEVRVIRLGLASMAVGLATMPLAGTVWLLALPIALMPIGTAFLFPATTSLVAGRGGRGRTGTVLGAQQAFGGVARMMGPLLAGVAFQHLGPGSPFWLASCLIVAAFVFSSVVTNGHRPEAPIEVPVPPEAS
jgi:predicted MFS family arabinose efflux permease